MKKFLIYLLVLASFSGYAQNDSTMLHALPAGYPVVVGSDTVYFVYSNVGSMKADERAERTSDKLVSLLSNSEIKFDSLRVNETEISSDILYSDFIICSVLDIDGRIENKSRQTLATEHLQNIKSVLKSQEAQYNFRNIAKRLIFLVLILVILFFVIKYFRIWQLKLRSIIFKGIDKYFSNKKLVASNLISIQRQQKLFDVIFLILYYAIVIILIVATLPILFRLFPQTRKWGDLLIAFILHPLQHILNKFIAYIPNAITILIVYFIFKAILKGILFVAVEIKDGKFSLPGFYADWAITTYNLIRFILWIFFFIIIFPYLPGSESPVFKGFSVFLGLLISIGSSSAISNMLSGLVITYMRPFLIGDRVKVGDVTGDVLEKSLLVTRIKTIKNEIISVPNQFVMSGNTINYTTLAKENKLILYTSVTIGYDAAWRIIHSLLVAAALETKGILTEPTPFVLQTALNDFYVEYQVNAFTNNAQVMAETYSNMHQKIQDKFNEAGVEIMSPHYGSLRDGNTIAIPDEYKPKDYKSPYFKIKGTEL